MPWSERSGYCQRSQLKAVASSHYQAAEYSSQEPAIELSSDDGWCKQDDFIHGHSIPSLRGRTTLVQPTQKRSHIKVNLPPALYEAYKDVTLNIDFFYVNGIAILHTILNCLTFRHVDFLPSQSEAQFMHVYNRIKHMYRARGFKIVDFHGNNEFAKIHDAILPTKLTLAAAHEHVEHVKHSVQTKRTPVPVCVAPLSAKSRY